MADPKNHVLIENVQPSVDGGRYAAKAIIGETCDVEADIFRDGHEQIHPVLLWRHADEKKWNNVAMKDDGNDRWQASFAFDRLGVFEFSFEVENKLTGSTYCVVVEPPLARFSAWYEMFVRSQGSDPKKSGT